MHSKQKKIAYYLRATDTASKISYDIDTFIADIKNGRWQDQILKLRALKNPDAQEKLKDNLPNVTVSGVFTERSASTLETHSGFIAIDIDQSKQTTDSFLAPQTRDLLLKDNLVYAAFISCRGNGVCALVRINPKAQEESYAYMSRHFYNSYQINTDPVCKNIARIRYVSYDPDAAINEHAGICPAEPKPRSEKKPLKKYYHTDEDFQRILEELKEKNINLTASYENWLLTGLSFLNKFPEDQAREYFHKVSEIYPEYDYDQADKKFDSLAKDNREVVPIDWFYAQIEKLGLKAYSKETEAKLIFQVWSNETDEAIDPAVARQTLDELPLVTKIKYYLQSKHQEYIRNEFTQDLTADGEMLTDIHLNSFYIECREKVDDKTQFELIRRMLQSNFVKSVHPFKEFIKTYTDNPPLPSKVEGNIDAIIAALTTDTLYADIFIRKWLVAMVSSAFGVTSDLVLVFCGPQGTGKTEWFRRILPPELSRYRASLNWSGDRDEVIRMSRNLIMIDDEMGGKSQREEKQIKKISSIDKEQTRGAYKSMDEYYNRAAIFCGTTNDEWILSDPTGNRRFLPIYISRMDHAAYNKVDKGLLFFELYLLWQSGFNTTLTEDEQKKLDEIGARFQKPHIEEELIARYICEPAEGKESQLMTATDIMVYLRRMAPGMGIRLKEVGSALQKAGFERDQKRHKGKRPWFYTVVLDHENFNDEII